MRVHSEKQTGPHRSAFVFDRDQVGVHSKFLIETTSECILILIYHWECTLLWAVLQRSSALHSHVVVFASMNALRCGPFGFKECTPIWPLMLFGVHYDVICNNFWSALPFGPHHFQKCTPKWSTFIADVGGQHCPCPVRCLSAVRILSGFSVRCLSVRILSVSTLSTVRILSGF